MVPLWLGDYVNCWGWLWVVEFEFIFDNKVTFIKLFANKFLGSARRNLLSCQTVSGSWWIWIGAIIVILTPDLLILPWYCQVVVNTGKCPLRPLQCLLFLFLTTLPTSSITIRSSRWLVQLLTHYQVSTGIKDWQTDGVIRQSTTTAPLKEEENKTRVPIIHKVLCTLKSKGWLNLDLRWSCYNFKTYEERYH